MPAIPSTGPILITDLSTEFGGSAPHSISEYYRNGANVPSNNTLVPTSGGISFSQFRGAINEIIVTSSAATNLDISTLFSSNWTSTVPKRLIIPSGVTIGGVGAAALTIPANMAGTLEIDNAGEIIGFGGAAGGGAGGDAIANAATGVTINNTALLAGGGGGGNTGGQGGNGSFTTSSIVYIYNTSNRWVWDSEANNGYVTYAGTSYYSGWYTYQQQTYTSNGGGVYRGSLAASGNGGKTGFYRLGQSQSTTTSTTGGVGGTGGVGQGYLQALTTGSAGASGGTNAGTGGSGADGATYGLDAADGSTGSNGNVSNGSAGLTGGLGGSAVSGTTITLNNTGTVHGAVI